MTTVANVRSFAAATDFTGVQPYPIPDGYMWTDDAAGRSWTNNGTGNVLNLTPLPGRVQVYEQENVWQ